jgi:hypothetical protein
MHNMVEQVVLCSMDLRLLVNTPVLDCMAPVRMTLVD